MTQRRLLKTISFAAFGVGTFTGLGISKLSSGRSCTDSCLDKGSPRPASPSKWERFLPVPAVEAASSLIPAGGLADVLATNKVNSDLIKLGNPGTDNLMKVYDDFVVSYDRRNRTANWVFEHINKEKVQKSDKVNREDCKFYEEPTVHAFFRSSNDDYKGSGFDRGHLSPAANHRWSQKAMNQSFVLTNISPQVGKGFNRDGWEKLERYMRHLTKDYRNVYICTGPLYLPRRESNGKLYVKYEVIGKNNVSVPTHFFKVALLENSNGSYEILSFVMPNEVLPAKLELKNYLVPLESIERSAGFLLFNRLPKSSLQKVNGKKC